MKTRVYVCVRVLFGGHDGILTESSVHLFTYSTSIYRNSCRNVLEILIKLFFLDASLKKIPGDVRGRREQIKPSIS